MLKTSNISQKRNKPAFLEEQILQVVSNPRKIPFQPFNQQFKENLIFQQSQSKEIWSKKEEQSLMISLLEDMVNEPYLNFTWVFLGHEESVTKISKKMKKSFESCSRKLDQIKSVNEQIYSDLDCIDFLLTHWKVEGFKSKIGKALIKELKQLKNQKSQHMIMCEQMIQRMDDQQPAFMKLFDLIMKN